VNKGKSMLGKALYRLQSVFLTSRPHAIQDMHMDTAYGRDYFRHMVAKSCVVDGWNVVQFDSSNNTNWHHEREPKILDVFNLPPGSNVSCTFHVDPGYQYGPGMVFPVIRHLMPGTVNFALGGGSWAWRGLTANSIINVTLDVPRSPHLTLQLDPTTCRPSSWTGRQHIALYLFDIRAPVLVMAYEYCMYC
jgi:hypothetical protein